MAIQELGQHQRLARLQSAGNTHTLPPKSNWWKTIQVGINLRADDVPANPMAQDSSSYAPLGDKSILMGQGKGCGDGNNPTTYLRECEKLTGVIVTQYNIAW